MDMGSTENDHRFRVIDNIELSGWSLNDYVMQCPNTSI